MVRFGTRGRDQQSHRAGSCSRQQEHASRIPRAENHTVVRGLIRFSNTPGLSTSSTNGISVLLSSEALVSVTRPNPRGEANASNVTTAASVPRRNRSMDQAMKAGIGATACSVLILVIVLLAMHTVPLTIG